jgi:hypothetical protein
MKTIKFEEAIKILKKRIGDRIPAGAELRDSPTTGGFMVSAELAWGADASVGAVQRLPLALPERRQCSTRRWPI